VLTEFGIPDESRWDPPLVCCSDLRRDEPLNLWQDGLRTTLKGLSKLAEQEGITQFGCVSLLLRSPAGTCAE